MKSLFITATGTGVGKTVFTATLASQLRKAGHHIVVRKPVISGYDPADTMTDTAILLRAQGLDAGAVEEVSPWRFHAALSPDMAARREGRTIDFQALIAHCRESVNNNSSGITLIEGVGGAFVPLDDRHLVADWIAELALPNILVTGSYLGTISHTVACVEAMVARRIAPSAVVISQSEEEPVPLEETRQTLMRYLDCPVLCFPRLPQSDAYTKAPDLVGLIGTL